MLSTFWDGGGGGKHALPGSKLRVSQLLSLVLHFLSTHPKPDRISLDTACSNVSLVSPGVIHRISHTSLFLFGTQLCYLCVPPPTLLMPVPNNLFLFQACYALNVPKPEPVSMHHLSELSHQKCSFPPVIPRPLPLFTGPLDPTLACTDNQALSMHN